MRVDYEGYTLDRALKSTGPGWKVLVEQAFQKLPDGGKIVQVKEKFGGLRIYAHNVPEEYNTTLRELENQSYLICERCGTSDNVERKPSGSFWIKTLCEECRSNG